MGKHDRQAIAATAARIIVESALTDWALARRKALDELGLPARGTPLPSDDDVIAEIITHHQLYGGATWRAQLRAQREYALEALQALQRFAPVLTGPVAEGWAHEGSVIRIEVSADNPKEIDYALIDLGVEFEPQQQRDGSPAYDVVDGDWPLRLCWREPDHAPDARYRLRLNAAQLAALLTEEETQAEADLD